MFQRLTLAKDLLRQDGLIFLSIDDNELFHLGLLMSRIFGEGNMLATVIWQKRYGGGAKTKHVVSLHEYVLCFARSLDSIAAISLPPDPEAQKRYKFRDSKFETRGPYFTQPLATNSMDARPNLRYPIPFQGEDVWPEKQWQWSKERTMAALANDELTFSKAKGKWSVRYKQYLKDDLGEDRGAKPMSIVVGPYTQEGTDAVKAVLGDGKAFTYPKPVGLIEHFISYTVDASASDIILDFFAGSGTTAHAVHKLNKEDGGNRRVILVSSTEATVDDPDKNLCRDVCATRVRRVIEGYGDTPGLGGDFAYLRCRRIAPGKLVEIDHAQVWTALQLLHCPALMAYEDKSILVADDDGQRLIYLPHYTGKDARPLVKLVREKPAVIIYTWQPERVRQRLRGELNVQIEPVPESLARRFGIRV